MGCLQFDGVDDQLKWTTLAATLSQVSDGAYTVAVLFRLNSTGAATWRSQITLLSSTGAGIAEAGVKMDASNLARDSTEGTNTGALTFVNYTNPYIFALSKVAGASVSPILGWKLGSGGAWTHTTLSGAIADQTAATMLSVGGWQNNDFFKGWIGVAACWEGAMSNANKETLDDNWRTSDWYSNAHGAPKFLAELNVAGSSVVDLIGNASVLTATGTTLDSGETLNSWNFNGTGTAAAFIARGPTVIDQAVSRAAFF